MNLAVEGLRAGYGSSIVIADLSLALRNGEAIALLGRNGMGKTTLLKAVLGFLDNVQGSVRIDEHEVAEWSTAQIVRLGIAYVPQEEAVFADLSVNENLDANVLPHGVSKARRERVFDYFPILAQRLRQRAGTLSGGEQKMLALARALLAEPKLLILDEICAGLQPKMVEVVEKALRSERERRATTFLLVEQNIDLALRLVDRVAVMKVGRLVFESSADASGLRSELFLQLAP